MHKVDKCEIQINFSADKSGMRRPRFVLRYYQKPAKRVHDFMIFLFALLFGTHKMPKPKSIFEHIFTLFYRYLLRG